VPELVWRELAHGVVRAADLERTDRLQRLELEIQLGRLRSLDADERRANGGAVNGGGCVADGGEWNVPARNRHRQDASIVIG
jgi:hypothetical protein